MAQSQGQQGCRQRQDGSCDVCCDGGERRSPPHGTRWPLCLASLCGCAVGLLAAVVISWPVSWSQVAVGIAAAPSGQLAGDGSSRGASRGRYGAGAQSLAGASVANVDPASATTSLASATGDDSELSMRPAVWGGGAGDTRGAVPLPEPGHPSTPQSAAAHNTEQSNASGCSAVASRNGSCSEAELAPARTVVALGPPPPSPATPGLLPTALWTLGGYHYVSLLDSAQRRHTLRLGAHYGAWQLVEADLTARRVTFRHANGQRWVRTL